jgi:hypothetical protein
MIALGPHDTYQDARASAQHYADALGSDVGIERGQPPLDAGKFMVRLLPRLANRNGWELRCEVVSPTGKMPEGPVPNGWIDPGIRPRSKVRR